ncbi:hypothetical protein EHQ23_14505 [Leptospira bourretii]|uniref:Uncharacterized protein n=1 Tax=Leptospira bourretii TaxID=2484962 RepID=A0A4R9IRS2_9LEPT|nr:hypothetical protein [Leptospira bourretii]TGK85828.1 hypothetical protein EHQ23_14505 [Leptospira bourretii]TGK94726.1 hypothetical protein EHQ26_01935 [Leptospira bourretii]TGL41281.1 hypothetical protein EHQ45_02480 [Leptospira bourretii]
MIQKVFRYTGIFLFLSSVFQCNPEQSNNSNIFDSLLTSVSLMQSQNSLNNTGLVSTREINIGLSPINLSNDTIPSDGHNSIRLIGDGSIVGGGLLVYVREKMIEEEIDLSVGQPQIPKAPLSLENGIPKFHTIPGKKYEAILDFYVDGVNNTEIDGIFVYLPFTATGNDQIEFFVSGTEGVGMFVNGRSIVKNVSFFTPVGNNLGLDNPQEREFARKSNYARYGGNNYVVEYLYNP